MLKTKKRAEKLSIKLNLLNVPTSHISVATGLSHGAIRAVKNHNQRFYKVHTLDVIEGYINLHPFDHWDIRRLKNMRMMATPDVSDCCGSSMIHPEPDDEIEQMGSLWRAYACYICRKCGKPTKPIDRNYWNGRKNKTNDK